MRIATLLCLLVLSALVVQAQTSRGLSTNRQALAGTNWRLVSLGPTGSEENIVPGTKPTLNFGEDGRASGSTGCNSFSGTYTVRGDTISFGRMISTKRACLDQRANQQEQSYLAALEQARWFRLGSDRLTINYINRRNALNFVSDAPDTPESPAPAEDDPVAALNSYYEAINNRNFDQAYRLWETPDTSLDRFTRGFADTRRSRLLIEPPVRVEGAAGSVYSQIPVIVVAETRGGQRFFSGCYTMRRTNQPGGTWRIYRATITQTSAANALRQPISGSCVR